jgi:multidrug efflux pump subunit AcrB
VAWPVITSTLTTLAAFSPLLFWPDIMGQFMGFMPRTLIVVLSASLFVALIINPALCSVFISARPRDHKEHAHPFVRGYERLLRATLRYRIPVLLIGFSFLVMTIVVYGRFGRGVELFPDVEPRNATIDLKFPQGTGIEQTDAVLARFEEKLPKYEDIEFFLTTVGQGKGGLLGGGSGTHRGNIHIEFVDKEERSGNSLELVNTIREDIGTVAGADIKVEKEEEGPPTGAAIALELSGDDFEELGRIAGEIKRQIDTVPGLVDLQDDLEQALPELQFRVDRHRAALLGLDTDTIGTFLRMAIYGLESSKFRADEDEYDITLRFPEAQRNTVNVLEQIYIPTPAGGSIPLSSLGKVVYTGGRGAISRKDQKRVVTITGENQNRGVDKILKDIQERLAAFKLPRGYTIRYRGDTEDMQESGAFLMKAFGIALGLILVILVIQFNSVGLPFVILLSVAMSLIGVMWGLLACHMRFGVIMTGVGVISLAGIVVNNAIVLIDCIGQRRMETDNVIEAIVAAGSMRLRPVLLTATTTILGLIPMAVGYSLEIHSWPPHIIAGAESSQWWAPMAVAVIFGLMVATMLTLLLVPAMYSVVDSIATFCKQHCNITDD